MMEGIDSRFGLTIITLCLLIVGLSIDSYGQVGKKGEGKPKPIAPATTSKPAKKSTPPSNSRRTAPSKPNTSSNTAETEESTATMEETMNWIGGRLTDKSFYTNIFIGQAGWGSSDVTNTSFSVDGCTLNLIVEAYGTKVRVIIPFSDVDPLSIKINPNQKNILKIQTVKPSIKEIAYEERFRAEASFWFYRDEYTKRFEKAVRHAVKLCGGKASPF